MSAPALSALGAAVESRRAHLGMSENALADRTTLPRSTLRRRLEAPRTLKLSELERIADALELNGGWLARLALAST